MKMKHVLLTTLKVLVVGVILTLASCDVPWMDPIDGGGNGGPKPPTNNDCRIEGTIVKVPCGVGVYGDLWIRTKEGVLLQPVEQSFQTLCPIVLHEGDKVKFGYRLKRGPNPFDSAITCLIAIPQHTKIIIDCIQVVPNKGCGSLLLGDSLSDDNSVRVLEATIVGSQLKLLVGYSGCGVKPASNFELFWDGNVQESMPLQTRVYLHAKQQEFCQAYFTQELCYDVRMLKSKQNGSVKIQIQDKEVLF